ncbi:MAG: hypothetical protein WEB53_01850 [Akkermansiaceae bacterium]
MVPPVRNQIAIDPTIDAKPKKKQILLSCLSDFGFILREHGCGRSPRNLENIKFRGSVSHLGLLKAQRFLEIAAMPEPEVPSYVLTLVYLLSACLSLLGLLLIMSFRISRRLGRIERQAGAVRVETLAAEAGPSLAETSPGGAFETFLNEDPSRRELNKGEQFAAYRQWRHENGMNWSNS